MADPRWQRNEAISGPLPSAGGARPVEPYPMPTQLARNAILQLQLSPPVSGGGGGGGGMADLNSAAVAHYAQQANVPVSVMAGLLQKQRNGTIAPQDLTAIAGVPPAMLPRELGGLGWVSRSGMRGIGGPQVSASPTGSAAGGILAGPQFHHGIMPQAQNLVGRIFQAGGRDNRKGIAESSRPRQQPVQLQTQSPFLSGWEERVFSGIVTTRPGPVVPYGDQPPTESAVTIVEFDWEGGGVYHPECNRYSLEQDIYWEIRFFQTNAIPSLTNQSYRVISNRSSEAIGYSDLASVFNSLSEAGLLFDSARSQGSSGRYSFVDTPGIQASSMQSWRDAGYIGPDWSGIIQVEQNFQSTIWNDCTGVGTLFWWCVTLTVTVHNGHIVPNSGFAKVIPDVCTPF